MATLAEIEAAVDRYVESAPAKIHDLAAALVAAAYEQILESSPVRTGSYRASHIVMRGDTPAEIAFSASNRPDPKTPPRTGPVLDAPNLGDVKAALDSIREFGVTWIANPIFYAWFVELGTSKMDAQLIYASAASSSRARLASMQRSAT